MATEFKAMDWKKYTEGQALLQDAVVIEYAVEDKDHPWLKQRIQEYEKGGTKVFLKEWQPKEWKGGKRMNE